MKKNKIINTFINIGNYEEFIHEIFKLSKNNISSYVCVANVHMIIESYKNKSFCQIINNANLATPDGMPLAKAMKLLYNIRQDRVAGMDLMPDIMKVAEKQGLSIFLYGSTEEVLQKIIKKASKEFPYLKLTAYSPPFRPLSKKEKNDIVKMINNKNPDFTFVALGCPKQEKWMAEHKGKILSCMVGLGGAFEVYAEVKSRAPKWMQNYSLEWLYRLLQDPKRLWKRYFTTNILFIILLTIQIINVKILKKNA